MAQLKNHGYHTINPEAWGQKSEVTIGHNRMLIATRTQGLLLGLVGTLHGHPVATFTPLPDQGVTQVTLDPSGYPTSNTREAMKDFVGAILRGQPIEAREVRSTLELMGIGAGTAFTVDALLDLV